ncbi:MAG TPA: DNA adenine methylase [Alphaproteobacteria bacterium]
MKYMGSKAAMLQNGLGETLATEINGHKRFVDVFAGSGAVAVHVARRFKVKVLAFDLQHYSVCLTQSVLGRRGELDCSFLSTWASRAAKEVAKYSVPPSRNLTRQVVSEWRAWCEDRGDLPITRAYGGHYFSPQQSVWLDAFRRCLPSAEPEHTVALASLIQAASRCAAAPGHTAQPFQPTRTAKPHLGEAWAKNIEICVKNILPSIADKFALREGHAEVKDANVAVEDLTDTDLVFIDPPYSGVHYSRFYHVLETIALGQAGEVSGVGRYPHRDRRPWSQYSVKSEAPTALDDLLESVAAMGATAILTFPDHDCSNGLSGELVREIGSLYFDVRHLTVDSKFSTLGGRSAENGRAARHQADELILCLKPKRGRRSPSRARSSRDLAKQGGSKAE